MTAGLRGVAGTVCSPAPGRWPLLHLSHPSFSAGLSDSSRDALVFRQWLLPTVTPALLSSSGKLLRARETWPERVCALEQRALHILCRAPRGAGKDPASVVPRPCTARPRCSIWGQPSGLHRGCHCLHILDSGDGAGRVGSSLTPIDPQGRKQESCIEHRLFHHFNEQG